MNRKSLFAFGLAFAIGFGCRALGIPVPAPTALLGALLVLAMTSGYLLADGFLARRMARSAPHGAGKLTGERPR
jgi:XapX domain-containing protein